MYGPCSRPAISSGTAVAYTSDHFSLMLVSTRSGAICVWPNERPIVHTPFSFAACTSPAWPALSLPPTTSAPAPISERSEEHTSELQSRFDLVCRLLLEKKKKTTIKY